VRKFLFFLLLCCGVCAAQTTPNYGFGTPPYGTPGGTSPTSWNVIYNNNFAALDSLLSGNQALLALNVTNKVTASQFCIGTSCITSWGGGGGGLHGERCDLPDLYGNVHKRRSGHGASDLQL
jgi:hypothetical protein